MAEHLKLPTLLVISENSSVCIWVKKHLDDQFFIVEARKRSQALETVRTSALDFIILDSAVEDFDPLALCREIRKQGTMPILLITGRLNKTYRQTATKAGVSDFLLEELDAEELASCIATGRQTQKTRQKTENLSSKIPKPKKETS